MFELGAFCDRAPVNQQIAGPSQSQPEKATAWGAIYYEKDGGRK